ncbi:MAG: alpha-L-fucosidase [Clostridiales bacterium]|nr:alpha-L-fucosidase [Clostridiales bacterium]
MSSGISINPIPTKQQLAWADAELGVLIHYDIPVFAPGFEWRENFDSPLDPKIFNPTELDTDQWLETAAAMGAQYAVLVAKHCTGFCLWPTRAHEYSVKNSPWRDGKGDIVGDFIESCKKYDIRPGLYYSVSANGYLKVDNPGKVLSGDPGEQENYNRIVIEQITELWSNYGELFEIWFDGGALPPEQGGPNLTPLLKKHQPNAVCFQGPPDFPSLVRWVGNEDGRAPYPCWSRADILKDDTGVENPGAAHGAGNPIGALWAPAESDMPNRKPESNGGGWFWKSGQDHMLFELDELMDRYYTSVGRNSNLLLGMVIDDRGLVPQADFERFAELGKALREKFKKPIAQAGGEGFEISFYFEEAKTVNHAIIMEDLSKGERVRGYLIEAEIAGEFQVICQGTCIGHKRIERFDSLKAHAVRLKITECQGLVNIRRFALYDCD